MVEDYVGALEDLKSFPVAQVGGATTFEPKPNTVDGGQDTHARGYDEALI